MKKLLILTLILMSTYGAQAEGIMPVTCSSNRPCLGLDVCDQGICRPRRDKGPMLGQKSCFTSLDCKDLGPNFACNLSAIDMMSGKKGVCVPTRRNLESNLAGQTVQTGGGELVPLEQAMK